LTKIYKMSESGKAQLRRRTYVMYAISGAAVITFGLWTISSRPAEDRLAYLFPAIIVAGIIGFMGYRQVLQVRPLQDSVQIVLGEDFIIRRQANMPEVRLPRGEVTHLIETQEGLVVHTSTPGRQLYVPRQLAPNDYAAVRAQLVPWAPLKPAGVMGRLNAVGVHIAFLAAFTVFFLSNSLWIVIPVGLALLGLA
jgi:hypothetical protein